MRSRASASPTCRCPRPASACGRRFNRPARAPTRNGGGIMDTNQSGLERGYDVGGVRLERPFQVLRLGHFGFNVANQETALRFYGDLLGLPVTDTVDFGREFKVTSPTGQD